jgi:hypothetical protein
MKLWINHLAAAALLSALLGPVAGVAEQWEHRRDDGREDFRARQSDHFLKELYFYPPSNVAALQNLFDPDTIVNNATTGFPIVDGMRGIALNIYWSQLCPLENQCNFAIIDRVLDFWRQAGRKVILSVALNGPPLEKFTAGGKEFVSATPDWVLAKVATFQSQSNSFLGLFSDWQNMVSNPQFTFPYARYDDPQLVVEIQKLVTQLGARYDGNPAISYVRMGTGRAGDDNPIGRTNFFGPGTGMPGFTNHVWIGYSRQVVDAYFASFHTSRLEFDMAWTTVVAAGAPDVTPITLSDQEEAENFLGYVVGRDAFMAFPGGPMATNSVTGASAANPQGVVCTGFDPIPDATTSAVTAAPYAEVEDLRQRGLPFGLGVASLANPCTAPAMTQARLQRYQPRRVIFLADWAALINFSHEGVNPQNQWEIDAATNFFIPFTTGAAFPPTRPRRCRRSMSSRPSSMIWCAISWHGTTIGGAGNDRIEIDAGDRERRPARK